MPEPEVDAKTPEVPQTVAPDKVAAYNSETVRLCQRAEHDVACSKDEWEEAKRHASSLGKRYEQSVEALRRLIRERRTGLSQLESGQGVLPFTAEEKPDDAWRSVPIAELGLSDGLLATLDEAGLKTIGAIADWTAGGKRLTDVPGVGEKKAEMIEEALSQFWAKHPTATAEPADDAWQQTPIADLGLETTLLGKLAAHEVATAGDVALFLEELDVRPDWLDAKEEQTLLEAMKALREHGDVEPEPPATNRQCNKCNAVRPGSVGVCACGCPEFGLTSEPVTAEAPAAEPPAKPKKSRKAS